MQFNKVFFNIVKILFKSIERICRSGKMKIGSKAERFLVLGCLRKKYLTSCQILRSKHSIYSSKKSVFRYSEGFIQFN